MKFRHFFWLSPLLLFWAVPSLFRTGDPAPSFKQEVFPIIKTKCNVKDCHHQQRKIPVFTTYEGIKPLKHRVLRRIKDRSIPMPPRESGIVLTKAEIETIEAWINAGAPQN